MDRESRRMLAFLRKSDLLSSGSCLYADFYDAYCQRYGCQEQSAMACLRHLESLGYILPFCDQSGRAIGFELEHKGHHQRYFHARDRWLFVRNSFIIPAVVAFLTALATNAAREIYTSWLSQLLQR